ncbi:MAG: response regulator [Chloroflexi bacterium]|nr:response regulator [Chloroflexota bacterium]
MGCRGRPVIPWAPAAVRAICAMTVVVALAVLAGWALGVPLLVSEVGLALFATSTMVIFTVMIWLSARRLNDVDDARGAAAGATRSALHDREASHRHLEQEMAERARAEAEAHASEERFQVAFRASPAGMALLRLSDQTFVSVNESWLATMGLTAAEVIGRTADELRLIDPVEREAMREQARHPGTLVNADLRFRTSSGALRHGLISTQIVQVGGEPHILATVIDITDRVFAEQELRDANLRLESTLSELRATQQQLIEQERIGALGQLASGIAHDFNNALGPILGYSDLLLEEPALLEDRAVTLEYVRAINTAAQGAAGVVARLRDFYRRRQNGDSVGPVHVPDVIAQAISLTRPRWKDQAQARGLTIDILVEVHDVPPLNGSPADLRDALVNLILNAVDALERDGEIALRARVDDAHVLVEVADTGVGMSDDVRRQCLEPFFTTKGDRGTGLGLGLVQGTIQRLGGSIEIESAVDLGTTIRLRLPSGQDVPAASATDAPRQGASRTEAARILRVLVVDDEPMVRDAVRRFLEIDQHCVDVASTGVEAASMLGTTAYDLIMTDRAMPEMGGDELAQLVKRQHPTTPVLMLTGFGDLMSAAGEQPEGVDLVLSKPTTLGRLRAAIAALVPEPADASSPPGEGFPERGLR